MATQLLNRSEFQWYEKVPVPHGDINVRNL
jgi:hypothetical protein